LLKVTPTTTKALLDAGYAVKVERSPERIFEDEEFAAVGATLVPEGSWTSAPSDHLIIGLKELPDEVFPLQHTHIQFAHCYKNQSDWDKVLARFPAGNGTLLDLEFLQDDTGRRVAAFGYHAGYAGAAVAIMNWAWQLEHGSAPLPPIHPYASEAALVSDVKAVYQKGLALSKSEPQILVIGALGRCGKGAVDLCLQVGVPTHKVLKWDMAETAKGGPFTEIIESDIFVNCIYLSSPIPPFINAETLASPARNLSVVCDVSCDTTNPHNPIPIYDICTTFDKPTVPVPVTSSPPLSVISIDHLPTMLPREASEAFSAALLPSLLQLKDRTTSNVWVQAENLFREKVATLPDALRQVKAFVSGESAPVPRA
jgi:saccharopine dehydrogenase (NAD+, L-lysine-forming)